MDSDIKASHLMYIVGIVLGIIAVVYFGREIIADLSPTVKSALLIIGFPTFLAGGSLIQKRILDKFLYILSVFSYLVFLWSVFDTFELGSNTILIALVISSIIFIGIGYQWEKEVKIGKKWKKIALIGLIVFAIGLVSFDVAGSQPSYKLDLQKNVNFEGVWEGEDEKRIHIGKLVVKNDFLFSRHTDPPDLEGCLYTPEKHNVHIYYSKWEIDIISGESQEEIEVSFYPPHGEGEGRPTYMENIQTIPIEIANVCPDNVDEPKLVITTAGDATGGDTLTKLEKP